MTVHAKNFGSAAGAVARVRGVNRQLEMRGDARIFQSDGHDEPDGANNGVPARFCEFSFRTQKRKRHDSYKWG